MVFRKRGGIKRNEHFKLNRLDVANDFNYSGKTFCYTGNFDLNTNMLYEKGLKAMNVLVANLRKCKTLSKVSLQLIDLFVTPTVSYGCEIWGFSKSQLLENLHVKLCKLILSVH